MTVAGKVRWTNLNPSRLIPRAIDKIVDMAQELNRDYVPRGATGKLQSSFRVERSERSVRFYWDVPYAKYVDEGTKPGSPGRYVPAIGKRLINTSLSTRRQVFQQALREGFSKKAAKAALKTPMTREKEPAPYEPGITEGAYYGRRRTSSKVPGEITLGANGPGRIIGGAYIKTGLTTRRRKHVERHELFHAVQWAGGRSFLETDTRALEREAELGALLAADQRKKIGTHPGIKGQHFSTHIVNLLKPYTVSYIIDELKGASA
jgi:hypothetical protein